MRAGPPSDHEEADASHLLWGGQRIGAVLAHPAACLSACNSSFRRPMRSSGSRPPRASHRPLPGTTNPAQAVAPIGVPSTTQAHSAVTEGTTNNRLLARVAP